jgi:hypothetical protein
LTEILSRTGVLRKNLMVLSFRLIFMPPFFPVDIRDADRPGQSLSTRKPQGMLILGRPFSLSRNLQAGFQKTQSLLPLVPVMAPMGCLPFILWSFARVGPTGLVNRFFKG